MASQYYKLGSTITGTTGLSFKTQAKSFKQHFGVTPHTCNVIAQKLKSQFNYTVCRVHLLWSLYFLCCYPKVKLIRKLFSVDVKTFRKHTHEIILRIRKLKIVSNSNCLIA